MEIDLLNMEILVSKVNVLYIQLIEENALNTVTRHWLTIPPSVWGY